MTYIIIFSWLKMLFISDCESFGDACVFITKQLQVYLYAYLCQFNLQIE